MAKNTRETDSLQQNVQPDAPFDAHGSETRCSRCNTEVPPGNQCIRCGAFLTGNAVNLRHGLRRYQTTGVMPADLRVSVDEFKAALIADQGGLEELTAVRAGLCRLLVDAEVGRRLLMAEVIRQGIASRGGRAAYDRLLSTTDRYLRLSAALGLERRLADGGAGLSIEAYVAAEDEKARQALLNSQQGPIEAPDGSQHGEGGGEA